MSDGIYDIFKDLSKRNIKYCDIVADVILIFHSFLLSYCFVSVSGIEMCDGIKTILAFSFSLTDGGCFGNIVFIGDFKMPEKKMFSVVQRSVTFE